MIQHLKQERNNKPLPIIIIVNVITSNYYCYPRKEMFIRARALGLEPYGSNDMHVVEHEGCHIIYYHILY